MFVEGGRGPRAGCSVYVVEKWLLSESSLNEAPAEILVIMSAEPTPLEKMPESALSSEVGPFLALTSGSTSVPMPHKHVLPVTSHTPQQVPGSVAGGMVHPR